MTSQEKECAEMYALGCIGKEDVEYLLHCSFESLPDEWTKYADDYLQQYEHYILEQQVLEMSLNK